MHNGRQANIWTNADMVYWRILRSLTRGTSHGVCVLYCWYDICSFVPNHIELRYIETLWYWIKQMFYFLLWGRTIYQHNTAINPYNMVYTRRANGTCARISCYNNKFNRVVCVALTSSVLHVTNVNNSWWHCAVAAFVFHFSSFSQAIRVW